MKEQVITLAHGNGGQMMQQLIDTLILKEFKNPILDRLEDSAVIPVGKKNARIAFTTDCFVVSPIFFPGGDIGKLAVCGTVNDLSVMGAMPRYISAGVIIEEGFDLAALKKIIVSMKKTADAAGVAIVCGDTKVVNKGNCDKIFITTSGIGFIDADAGVSASAAKPGDAVLVSGTIGDHGIAILSQREGIAFKKPLMSDCAPVNALTAAVMSAARCHVMRDPTRGGVATTLNEIARQSNVGIEIDEAALPVRQATRGACEILGLDPLYLACEGRILVFVPQPEARKALKALQRISAGKEARIIGAVTAQHKKEVHLLTITGAPRILDVPIQDQMPRIC